MTANEFYNELMNSGLTDFAFKFSERINLNKPNQLKFATFYDYESNVHDLYMFVFANKIPYKNHDYSMTVRFE